MMKTTAWLVLSSALCGLFQDTSAAQTAPSAAAGAHQQNSTSATASSGLDATFADTLRQLTRFRLQRALRINSKVPGTYSAEDFDTIKGELARIDQQEGKAGEVIDWFSAVIRLAEVSKFVADANWKRVSAVQKQTPGVFS